MEAEALGGLVCIGTALSEVGPFTLSLELVNPGRGHASRLSRAPRCQSIRIWKVTGMWIQPG